ncbi:MAG: methionine adenosyltransferase [Firmicutes bacterium]|nr:methionine adenosyltransferase [Bacillota bacterium]
MRRLLTSESVTVGHPDKVCDQISDAVLDAILAADPDARVACDVAVNTGFVLVMGEITTKSYADIAAIARRTIKEIGYTDPTAGFDYASCAVLTSIDEQSPDISQGVSRAAEFSGDPADAVGAGDQGMVFGYACDETAEYMPAPITLAHALTKAAAQARRSGRLNYLRPDGKGQVTVVYEGGVPEYIDTVVLSLQHTEDAEHARIERDLTDLIRETLPARLLTKNTKYYINPTGRFVVGGPAGDSGLTGRKIIVDTYGGYCPHGGGAFSGKDPTKVDRSAAYYARYAVKNIVAAGLASRIQLEVSYAIGRARPVAVNIETFGTAKVPQDRLDKAVGDIFDFRPYSIIRALDLKKPGYIQTARNGHFGNPAFSWERLDKVEMLKEYL